VAAGRDAAGLAAGQDPAWTGRVVLWLPALHGIEHGHRGTGGGRRSLALAAARLGTRMLLVDAHLLGLDHQPGALVPRHLVLAGLLVRDAVVPDVVAHVHVALGLVLAAGNVPHGLQPGRRLHLVALLLLGLLLLGPAALGRIADGALEVGRTAGLGARRLLRLALLGRPAVVVLRLTTVVAAHQVLAQHTGATRALDGAQALRLGPVALERGTGIHQGLQARQTAIHERTTLLTQHSQHFERFNQILFYNAEKSRENVLLGQGLNVD